MDWQDPQTILSRVDREALIAAAEALSRMAPVQELMPPSSGMVMMQVIDTVNLQPFNLGEVLITECEVQIADRIARGYALGTDGEVARARAMLLGALDSERADIRKEAEHFLFKQVDLIEAVIVAEQHLVSKTLVKFDTMEAQDAQHKGSKL